MPFDGTQLNPTVAHLLRAKRCIEEHGWNQGGYESADGRVCALGALLKTGWGVGKARMFLLRVVDAVIYDWNDTPGRTIEEVYDALDRAIALAMEGP
jgi:hypothetical protein